MGVWIIQISKNNLNICNLVVDNKGGAIYCEGKVNIFNSKLSDNRALVDGGAIYAEKGTVKVTLSNFTDNATQDNDGGAIYAISDVNVVNCLL